MSCSSGKHTRHPSNCSWTRSTLTCPSLFEHKIFVFFTNIKLELFESEKNIIQIQVFGFIALSFFRLELKPKHRICPNSAEQYLFNATWFENSNRKFSTADALLFLGFDHMFDQNDIVSLWVGDTCLWLFEIGAHQRHNRSIIIFL